MQKVDIDRICDPTTSEEVKMKVEEVLRLFAGMQAQEARLLHRYVGNAIDDLAVMPTISS